MSLSGRTPRFFAAFVAALLLAAGAARIFRSPRVESTEPDHAESTTTAAGKSHAPKPPPSITSSSGYAEKTPSPPPSPGSKGEALPGGKVPVLAPAKTELSPELNRAMDGMHVRKMVENFVELVERGRTPSELEQALISQGALAKEALGSVMEKRKLSADTMAKLRKTYDAIP